MAIWKRCPRENGIDPRTTSRARFAARWRGGALSNGPKRPLATMAVANEGRLALRSQSGGKLSRLRQWNRNFFEDGYPGPLHHLVLGQRPCDDLSRPGPRIE